MLSAALILSYSRGSLVGLLVAILSLLVTVRVRIGRTLGAAAACLTVAALISGVIMPALSDMYWLRVRGSFEYIWSSPDGILSGRLTSWGTLLDFLAREIGMIVAKLLDQLGTNHGSPLRFGLVETCRGRTPIRPD